MGANGSSADQSIVAQRQNNKTTPSTNMPTGPGKKSVNDRNKVGCSLLFSLYSLLSLLYKTALQKSGKATCGSTRVLKMTWLTRGCQVVDKRLASGSELRLAMNAPLPVVRPL